MNKNDSTSAADGSKEADKNPITSAPTNAAPTSDNGPAPLIVSTTTNRVLNNFTRRRAANNAAYVSSNWRNRQAQQAATTQTGYAGITPTPTYHQAPAEAWVPQGTPSHMPMQQQQQQQQPQIAHTPGPWPLPSSQYNQTVPRDFAYRAPPPPAQLLPPPVFTLSRPRSNTIESTGDPFMSSTVVKSGFEDSLVSWRSSTDGGLAVPGVRPSILPKPDFFSRRPESSKLLRELTECGTALPSLEKVLDNKYFPFIESCSQAHSSSWGVLKISNIPFDVNRAEVIALIGKNSRILNDVHEPVHIIMERTSSKTEDVFVEFMTSEDASKCIERLIKNSEKGRPPRLGNRVVTLKISDQTELMKALFPHAKGVDWLGSVPQIKEVGPDGWDHERFRGFMTMDEMAMLVKHAEVPTRAPFSHNVPQRPFECLISTIKKLPWYRSENITVAQRYQIYDATEKLVTMLKEKIDLAKVQQIKREIYGPYNHPSCNFYEDRQRVRHQQEVHANLNEQLFKRLVKAAMICPGFSALQKDNIAHIAGLTQPECATFNQPFFAYEWRHLHTICPRPNKMPMDLLDWYIAFIRQQSSEQIADRPEKEQAEIYLKARHTTDYFGYLWVEINLPEGPALDQMSLKDLYLREVGAIHRGFTRVLKRSTNPEALPESEEKEQ